MFEMIFARKQISWGRHPPAS